LVLGNVKVTNSRAAVDFATCTRELTDVYSLKAKRILSSKNLPTHSAGGALQAFPAAKARRRLRDM
jgi:hypothetical protein